MKRSLCIFTLTIIILSNVTLSITINKNFANNLQDSSISLDEISGPKLKDIAARGNSIWTCNSENEVMKWEVDENASETIFADNNFNVKCKMISLDSSELPWIITDKDQIASLKRIHSNSYLWTYYQVCGLDISCGFYDGCYFIDCNTKSIKKIEADGSIKEIEFKDKNQVFQKIAIGLGIDGDVIYALNTIGDILKFEKKNWQILANPNPSQDIAVSDSNELFFSTSSYISKFNRISPNSNPERILNWKSSKLSSLAIGNAELMVIDDKLVAWIGKIA